MRPERMARSSEGPSTPWSGANRRTRIQFMWRVRPGIPAGSGVRVGLSVSSSSP